ncbi:hypothetical protein SISSUDRAFT_1130833 [Sistotremastrum suecicum HHB10207 ss-3]|uniref:T cell CD4 receptor C-terminal region domain-containing protein n=1 Tax=Sistotremastrum suecicum HHB10207 ss-3 TaxID=1314776 RepID=A0A166AY40_9AGAM|nr:hypothetical protein SISSUDRAFT_1130833 [Sistotremastrum suecicum HHB10207 ss-3]
MQPLHFSCLVATLLTVNHFAQISSVLGASPPECFDFDYTWSWNSLQQTPCQVTADLAQACPGIAPFKLEPIGPGQSYTVQKYGASRCQCSTVFYCLISACALCQGSGRLVSTWQEYSFNCSLGSTSMSVFPEDIPYGTAVPQWAFQNVAGGSFSPTTAEGVGDRPESVNPRLSTPTTSPSPTKHHHSNVGAIAGGAAGGGVALLLAVGLLTCYCVKSRRRRRREEAQVRPHLPGTVRETVLTHGMETKDSM